MSVNARAAAMGDAYSAVCDGADALYWNPAGLGKVSGKSAVLMHSDHLQNSYLDFAGYSQSIGRFGSVGVGFQYFSAGTIEETDEFGPVGTFRPYDMAASLGWARKVKGIGYEGEFIIGVAAKFVQSKITQTAYTGLADVGAAWNQWKNVELAIGVLNLGDPIKREAESDDLPLILRVGGKWQARENWIVSLDSNFPRYNDPDLNIGTEVLYPAAREITLAGRAGYSTRTAFDLRGMTGFSTGLGLIWKKYGLDFAWSPFGRLGSSYKLSLSVKF